ncbi:MAG: PEP/pyruvate-binding domain-containing protein [Thermodesulfobacteriota bacterium]
MDLDTGCNLHDFEANFKIYHELMRHKIHDVLLVFTPYDAFIIEEDGSLSSRVVNEYHGLNLSHPPRMSRAASGREAIDLVREKHFDLIITMPLVDDMDGFALGREIRKIRPDLPVILLAHNLRGIFPLSDDIDRSGIDSIYVWSHDPDLLLALIKNVEDRLNAPDDTRRAMVRVLLLVEDSPHYLSYFLPLLYKEIMAQTQAVLDESLNEDHRLLKMRARPRILVAANYEEALVIYNTYRPYLHGVISDSRFPKDGKMDERAGLKLMRRIRKENADLPLLMLSAETANRKSALGIPAIFLDKNEDNLLAGLHDFFLDHLGFGDFAFRYPDGRYIGRARNLYAFEKLLAKIPDESLTFHASRNHFSNWIMARSEVAVASKMRQAKVADFADVSALRGYLISCARSLRNLRQQGVVVSFSKQDFDADIMDFVSIGTGSMGGKALGIAFMAKIFRESGASCRIDGLKFRIPKTHVITTSAFDEFVEASNLRRFREEGSDQEIAAAFRKAPLPGWLVKALTTILKHVHFPLSVRSSSIMEDARSRPYAGLYSTFMIANDHPDFKTRLKQLLDAVRLVYASAFFAGPRAFARSARQIGKDGMGVMIQELVGSRHGDYFYPAVSGVAMSHNFYPVGKMRGDEGVTQIALGFGKTVVEGEQSLRFSPRYPESLPQFSTVEDMLANSQRFFYALRMRNQNSAISPANSNLQRREIFDAASEAPFRYLASSYLPEEHRIRDGLSGGSPVLTFAGLLKYDAGLPVMIRDLLQMGRKAMGCDVEIEFAADLDGNGHLKELCLLQIRPMVTGNEQYEVKILPREKERAFCYSESALGHGRSEDITDIIYVRPELFEAGKTGEIALEIGRLNGKLVKEGRPYLLIGPGRWGSYDKWLGIPVKWQDISGVQAMVELRTEQLKVEPSEGTHFFQNITSLGIHYVTVTEGVDLLDWQWLAGQRAIEETTFLRHVRLDRPFVLKVNGQDSRCVMYESTTAETDDE